MAAEPILIQHRSLWARGTDCAPDLRGFLPPSTSAESKKASIEDFRIAKIRTMIGATDTTLASIFQELYDRAIDFGAHPNEQAVTSSAQISRDARQIRIDVRYLNDGVAVEVGLRSTAQVGVCCLQLFQHAYPEKFLLLGVKERLTDLWQRL